MAKAMIIFEDVNPTDNEGAPVVVRFVSEREDDCQDEPTVAEAAAFTFFEFISDSVKHLNEA